MSLLDRLFQKNTAITSASINAKIESAEAEIAANRDKLSGVMANVAVMNDEQHQAAEAHIASIRRAITRLEAARKHLDEELPRVIAAEEAQARAATDEALRKRAKAAANANQHGAKALLESYAEHAEAIADILAKLKDMDSEREAVNAALRSNPVAEPVACFNTVFRKAPDQQAGEQRAIRKCWVYRIPGSPPDQRGDGGLKFVREEPHEEVREATLDANGKAIPVGPIHHDYYGRTILIHPTLEDREIVVGRTYFRPGRSEFSLSTIHLPPPFAGQPNIWPRP